MLQIPETRVWQDFADFGTPVNSCWARLGTGAQL